VHNFAAFSTSSLCDGGAQGCKDKVEHGAQIKVILPFYSLDSVVLNLVCQVASFYHLYYVKPIWYNTGL